ncbi:MAG: hypothetical protein GY776_15620 [Alteromonas sp.]|nr:hypothetical protein [Alteromonas sp.]
MTDIVVNNTDAEIKEAIEKMALVTATAEDINKTVDADFSKSVKIVTDGTEYLTIQKVSGPEGSEVYEDILTVDSDGNVNLLSLTTVAIVDALGLTGDAGQVLTAVGDGTFNWV